jgi:rhodanese-related sulfurtransferase
MSSDEITADELDQLLKSNGDQVALLDVRQPEEHEYCRISGSLLIPLNELPWRASELNPEDHLVIYCHHGVRSLMAVHFLKRLGFEKVKSLRGGIDAWATEIEPSLPRY